MKNFYKNKKYFKGDKYYIMPCFNEDFSKTSYSNAFLLQRVNRTFIYAGGLSKWQCFEKTIQIYKNIEDRIGDCTLKVFTKDVDKARAVLNNYDIKNYVLKYVKQEELSNEIKDASFGFCIRENNIVNNVATPTKLSTYVVNGIIPIYSKYLDDFNKIANQSKYCVCADDPNYLADIVDILSKGITKKEIVEDYKLQFGNYYSSIYHMENLINCLDGIIGKVYAKR